MPVKVLSKTGEQEVAVLVALMDFVNDDVCDVLQEVLSAGHQRPRQYAGRAEREDRGRRASAKGDILVQQSADFHNGIVNVIVPVFETIHINITSHEFRIPSTGLSLESPNTSDIEKIC